MRPIFDILDLSSVPKKETDQNRNQIERKKETNNREN